MPDIHHILRGSSGYPQVFEQLTDPPPEIYIQGRIDFHKLVDRPVVGIVGTRRADSSGRKLAWTVSRLVAQAGGVVVSGLALGIDAEAHQGALEAKGCTLAVLGNGLDDRVISPQQHLGLAKHIVKQGGALLTEYPPTHPAGKYTYPARNRLIAAVCTHLVVIQAPQGSGALITVDHALSLGRPVATFPGPVLHPGWRGSNQLLKDGAEVLCEPLQVLDWVGLRGQAKLPGVQAQSQLASCLYQALKTNTCTTQELVELSGLGVNEVIRYMSQAELDGLVQIDKGKWRLMQLRG